MPFIIIPVMTWTVIILTIGYSSKIIYDSFKD